MREGTKRRVRIFLWVILAGTLIGISYGTLTGFAGLGTPAMGGLIGAVHGLAIAASIGLLEIFGGAYTCRTEGRASTAGRDHLDKRTAVWRGH